MSTTGESAIIRQPIKNEVGFGETSAAVTRYKYITVEHVYVCNGATTKLERKFGVHTSRGGWYRVMSIPWL